MNDWDVVKQTWQQNKFKFLMFLIPAIILLILAIFFKAYRAWLISSAQKLLSSQKAKDEVLKAEAEKAESQANEHQQKAKEIQKEVENVDSENDPDWNKKI